MAYTKVNIDDIEDKAAAFGLESQEARHVSAQPGTERIGVGHYRVRPGQRLEFGHRHRSMEEAYVVVAGSGTFAVDAETVPVATRDIIHVSPTSWRAWEAGPNGMELLAFGEHVEGEGESEMEMGWWAGV